MMNYSLFFVVHAYSNNKIPDSEFLLWLNTNELLLATLFRTLVFQNDNEENSNISRIRKADLKEGYKVSK